MVAVVLLIGMGILVKLSVESESANFFCVNLKCVNLQNVIYFISLILASAKCLL